MIRDAEDRDTEQLAAIYNHYIRSSVATFEEVELDRDEMWNRVSKVHSSGHIWLVAEENTEVAGYAYSTRWNERSAYRNTAEISVYISPRFHREGYGYNLYKALFSRLQDRSIHTVIAGITLPNPASIALHEKFGMTKSAHFTQVGYKSDRWLDVGYWQVLLEEN